MAARHGKAHPDTPYCSNTLVLQELVAADQKSLTVPQMPMVGVPASSGQAVDVTGMPLWRASPNAVPPVILNHLICPHRLLLEVGWGGKSMLGSRWEGSCLCPLRCGVQEQESGSMGMCPSTGAWGSLDRSHGWALWGCAVAQRFFWAQCQVCGFILYSTLG